MRTQDAEIATDLPARTATGKIQRRRAAAAFSRS